MQLVPISSGTPFPFVCVACGTLRHTAHSAQRGRAMANTDGPAFAAFYCGACAQKAENGQEAARGPQ